MTIKELFLKNIKKLPKINKIPPPASVNENLTKMFFSAIFVGAKNSGKSYGLCTLLKNYEDDPIKDNEGNTLPIRIILFAPTAYSVQNVVYKSLKNLDENDIITKYSDDAVNNKLLEIQKDKQDIEDYKKYKQIYKKFIKLDENINGLNEEKLSLLYKHDFAHYNDLPKLKYKYPPVVFMILDDLIGNNDCFKRGNCFMSNLVIKHRHVGINLIFTTQNPRSINNIIRSNIDLWILYKFSNIKMVLDKIYEDVSNILTEEQFEEAYKFATMEPHHALVIDTHSGTSLDKRLKRDFDTVITVQ